MRAVALADATLAHHAGRLDVPRYDRAALAPGVVHISVGAFHRAHQAVYFDDLARLGHRSWGVVGVSLHRPQMRAVLTAQDGLYTVVARGADGDRARVIGANRGCLFAPEEAGRVLGALSDPRIRLVTLTITAAGYGVDPATEGPMPGPAVLDDLRHPSRPRSALGFLVEALDRRRRAGVAPFTVLSCDNLPDNGTITRSAVLALAERRDPGLAAWIADRGAFPNSMVDRITPHTTPADRAWVEGAFGVADRWPVLTEPFSQWVVEDAFGPGRPPLEEVGVEVVGDVRPYALTKTRLLNAAHCALGHLGRVAGLQRTDEAMAHPVFAAYVTRMLAEEVAPLLPRVGGLDLAAYQRTVLVRLANPKMADRLQRLCRNGSGKVPTHVVSSIVASRERGRPHAALTLAVAGWLVDLRGVGEDGRRHAVDDPLAARLTGLARAGGTDPRGLLAERGLFGALGRDPGFAAELEAALVALDRDGVRATLARCAATATATAAA